MPELTISTPHGTWQVHQWTQSAARARLICLHGFARSGQDYQSWAPGLEGDFQLLAPDLPHHGATEWSHTPYGRETFIHLIEQLREDNPYWLAGFSFGGRVILSLLPHLPTPPQGIILLAPEGFETERLGFWERVPNDWRRGIVNWAAKNGRGLRWAQRLNQWGIIDNFSVKFVRKQLADDASIQRLLAAWNAMHAFPVELSQLEQYCSQHTLPFLLVGSEGDKIVDLAPIEENLKSACPHLEVQRLRDPGHNQVIRASAERVQHWLQDKIH